MDEYDLYQKLIKNIGQMKEEAYLKGREEGFQTALETHGLKVNEDYRLKWEKLRKELTTRRNIPFTFFPGIYDSIMDYMDILEKE